MPEMPHPREHHGKPHVIGGVDHFLIAHGAAGLDHGVRPRLGRFDEAVREGEEGIGCHDRALDLEPCVLGLDGCDAGRIHAARN